MDSQAEWWCVSVYLCFFSSDCFQLPWLPEEEARPGLQRGCLLLILEAGRLGLGSVGLIPGKAASSLLAWPQGFCPPPPVSLLIRPGVLSAGAPLLRPCRTLIMALTALFPSSHIGSYGSSSSSQHWLKHTQKPIFLQIKMVIEFSCRKTSSFIVSLLILMF